MSTKLLEKPTLPVKLVTILGDFLLDTVKWSIPEEYQVPSNAPSTDFGIVFVRYQDKNYAIDKAGLNIGLPQDKIKSILANLENQNKLVGIDLIFINILSNDGTNVADYSLEDGKTIARFLQSKPTMVGKYKSFIKTRVV